MGKGTVARMHDNNCRRSVYRLITTVDIGEGRSERLEVRRGDDPAAVVRAFCGRHVLPDSVVGPLTQHVLDNLRRADQVRSPLPLSPLFTSHQRHISAGT